MTEQELKEALAKFNEEKEAFEAKQAEQAKLTELAKAELEAKRVTDEKTIKALQEQIKKLSNQDKTDTSTSQEPKFDAEAFKAEMAKVVAEQIKNGLTQASEASKKAKLVEQITAIEKDFSAEGWTNVALEKYYEALSKQSKVNPTTPKTHTGHIFERGTTTNDDPIYNEILKDLGLDKGGK